MIHPGRLNLITDVGGVVVGNAEDHAVRSGVTVILGEKRLVGAVDVRGGAPGTRETEALDPSSLVEAIDGIVLAGGSVFGLEAAAGVTAWLAAHGRGLAVRDAVVPVVPAAILFDLVNGGDKSWGETPPYRALGRAAAEAAATQFRLGNAGAGLGAKAGRLKGGLGSASAVDDATGLVVGALVAVNALGSAVMDGQDTLWAWALELDGELGGQPLPTRPVSPEVDLGASALAGANTTIGVVATNARLTRPEAKRLAMMAQDGLARALRPAHTPFDGDALFALATGAVGLPENRPRALAMLGAIAADVVARAIARGVFLAETLGDKPSYRSVHGGALRHRQA